MMFRYPTPVSTPVLAMWSTIHSMTKSSIRLIRVDDTFDDEIIDPVDPAEARISEIEGILEDQDALIEIPDNELAALRAELAELRGEELPVDAAIDDEAPIEDDTGLDDEVVVDDEILADDTVAPVVDTTPQVVTRVPEEEGIVDTILGYLNNFWVWIGGIFLITVGILIWFMRRAANREDEEATGVWDALDADELDTEAVASTERLRALARNDEESIVVVETARVPMVEMPEASTTMEVSETMEAPAAIEPDEPEFVGMEEFSAAPAEDVPTEVDPIGATGVNKTLEDTFSSETAINLDQTDPVAEADFHMAYGLYDQAADLINGALTAEPERQDLLAKLCEIYFVWGNRDAFIDAAERLKAQVGDSADTEWDKIIIMGQQIAGDHEMFTGVSAEGVTKAVDLSFEGGMDEAADLDMDFASGLDDSANDVIDLGAQLGGEVVGGEIFGDDTGQVLIPPDSGSGIDFSLGDAPDIETSATREMPEAAIDSPDDATVEATADDIAETPGEDSVQTPTIEQQFAMDATGELPAVSEAEEPLIPPADATAEIDLDDLGLDLDGLDETSLAADIEDGDLEDTVTGQHLNIDELAITGTTSEVDLDDSLIATGKNESLDADDLLEATSRNEILDIEDALEATGELPAFDENTGIQQALDESTGIRPALSDDDATQLASLDDDDDFDNTDVGIDTSLLDATGQTQILTEDMAVQTATNAVVDLADTDATMLARGLGEDDTAAGMSDDAATLLAPLDGEEDEDDFDFAKTEALPKDVFSPDMSTDETGRMPGLAGGTDMDLDLDDLTAALKVSEVGDTINQIRDDATVEQPRYRPEDGSDDDTAATGVTQALAPEDLSGDLHEARTMTEVGTKLDLARAYVDMGDPSGARSILEEVLDEGDEAQKQQAQQLLDSLPS
jgi:pilus assembly protein FimV